MKQSPKAELTLGLGAPALFGGFQNPINVVNISLPQKDSKLAPSPAIYWLPRHAANPNGG